MSGVGREAAVPAAELERVVARLLARCERSPGGCLRHPVPNAQVHARLAAGARVVLSAARAVFAVANGAAAAEDDVMRTCEVADCLEPTHLAARPRGSHFQGALEKLAAARKWANASRRSMNQDQADALRALVAAGARVVDAARRFEINPTTAQSIVDERAYTSSARRTRPRGTTKEPRCSRCDQLGHWRSRGCPAAANDGAPVMTAPWRLALDPEAP